jgi:hypothetical protein
MNATTKAMLLDLIHKITKARKSVLLRLTHIYLIINENGTIYTGHIMSSSYIFSQPSSFPSTFIGITMILSLQFTKSQMITNQI